MFQYLQIFRHAALDAYDLTGRNNVLMLRGTRKIITKTPTCFRDNATQP